MILIKTFTRDIYDETTSIPVTFIRETPRILTKVGGLHDQYSFCL